MEDLLQILNKLEENTNIILEENKRLENEIKSLKQSVSISWIVFSIIDGFSSTK